MSEQDDPLPSYEDVMTGGIAIDPPKYSGHSQEDIRVSPNVNTIQTTPGVPQSVPGVSQSVPGGPQSVPGVPQSVPGVPQSFPGGPQSVPGVPQSVPGGPQSVPEVPQSVSETTDQRTKCQKYILPYCCRIHIVVFVVLFLLEMGRIYITPNEDEKPLDTVESTTLNALASIKKCSEFSIYSDGEKYEQVCFTPPPNIKFGYISAIKPQQCYNKDWKLKDYFPEGQKATLSCNPHKVLLVNREFLDPGTSLELWCTPLGNGVNQWKYPTWRYLENKKKSYKKWITVKETSVYCSSRKSVEY